MMTLFYYQDLNAGLWPLLSEASFFNCLFTPSREHKFEQEGILTKHSGLGRKITPSCK